MNLIEYRLNPPKIVVISRHCNFSANSINKPRPSWFDRAKCYERLVATKPNNCHLIVVFDGDMPEEHFINSIKGYDDIFVEKLGSDANSFKKCIEVAVSLKEDDNTIIYFVEDDYWHLPDWGNALREGFCLNPDYLTLYDHPAEYFQINTCEIKPSINYYWRSCGSTTNTYAVKLKTLLNDLHIHKKYSEELSVNGVTNDYQKFLELGRISRTLICPIPAVSTHCETAWLSPVIDWERMANV